MCDRPAVREPDEGVNARLARVEREALELRNLLSEAVMWARRPSPIPIVPFQDFLDRASAASGRNCTGKAARWWCEQIGLSYRPGVTLRDQGDVL